MSTNHITDTARFSVSATFFVVAAIEGVLAQVEIRVATPQNVETLWPSDISTRRRNHPCGRYDGFGDEGKT